MPGTYSRKCPNILITGSCGTGKTSLCKFIVKEVKKNLNLDVTYINVSEVSVKQNLLDGFDNERDTGILDEDKICDYIEDMGIDEGGVLVDFHSSDFFAERYFDVIFVLRTDNSILHHRLEKRGYGLQKITENVDAEIGQVCLDEAMDSYPVLAEKKLIIELQSDSIEDAEKNVGIILECYKQFMNKN